jgi:hypothetical protein
LVGIILAFKKLSKNREKPAQHQENQSKIKNQEKPVLKVLNAENLMVELNISLKT